MPNPASGNKAEMIILNNVRDTGRDEYHYHMISLLGVT